jgi:DNA primase
MAGLVSQSTLDQIRSANDIVEVIGGYLPLKRAGANFVTLCPFHREKTPSFSVNPHKQIFYCFGCHKGGDVFTFVKDYENLPFMDTIKRLAERAGIPLEFERNEGYQQAQHLKETLWQMHEQIAQRWQNALLNEACGQIARDYLAKRGVSEEAIKLFRIGYAPELWDDTVNWAKSKNYPPAIAEQAGLILRKEQTDHYYDRFRGRLMFPICDEQGRVIAFSGRILSSDEKTAKYVNSPETPIFTKGKVFYGLDKSKRAILDAGFAIVCEGQLDLIACYMGGVHNMVAPQGTAFTSEHARILKRYVDEVVLCFDSDNAGQNAASRALDSILAAGLAVRVATVPAPHDPDSYIKEQGGAAFQQLINNAEGFFDFYLNRLCLTNEPTTDTGRIQIVRSMGEAVLKTNSAVLIDTYAQKTAQRLGVKAESVLAEFLKARHSQPVAPEENETPAAPPQTPPPQAEFWLLRFILSADEFVSLAAEHMDLNWVTHPGVRQILTARFTADKENTWRGIPALLEEREDPGLQNLIAQAVAEDFPKKNLDVQIAKAIEELRNNYIDRELATLSQRLAQPNLSQEEILAIIQRKDQLRALNKARYSRNKTTG